MMEIEFVGMWLGLGSWKFNDAGSRGGGFQSVFDEGVWRLEFLL